MAISSRNSNMLLPRDWRDECTYETCGLKWAFWGYRPTKAANTAFAVLFGLSMLAFLVQGFMNRRWLGFTIAMVLGCLLEVIGYAGRIQAYTDLWHENPFLIQICCLTIAPAFLAAGIYLCLSRIVITFGADNSRIKPLSYPRIFIPCDLLSLILQGIGGGIASVRTHLHLDPTTGNNIMIAGLAVQVFTLFVFILLSIDFAIRTLRRIHRLGAQDALDPSHAKLRDSGKFKAFLVALSLSTLCIFTRCVYRVAELSEGWQGHLINVERYFIGLEGIVVVLAVYLLNAFHPGMCFKEALDAKTAQPADREGRRWFGRKSKSQVDEPVSQQVETKS